MLKKTWQSLESQGFRGLSVQCKNPFFIVHSAVEKGRVIPAIGFRIPKKHVKKAVFRNVCKRIVREYCRTHNLPFNKMVVSTTKKLPTNIDFLKKELKITLGLLESQC